MTDKRRKLHLNAFLMEAGHHEASWRRPDSNPRADFDLDHWIGLARLAESAKFDSLFLADGPAITGTGELRPPGQLEPLTLLTALSQATRRIGLIATVSTTYNDPYNLARRLASVDHVSRGRSGWNIVTSAGANEAANFGLDDRPGHAVRSPGAGQPGCLKPDAGAAPDDEDGLPEQVPLAVHGRRVDRGGHGSPGVVVAHVGSSVPACPAVMYVAYQPGQFASRWLGHEPLLRLDGRVAPGRHPGPTPGPTGFLSPWPQSYALLVAA